jgi:hypothetical protein
MIKEMPVENVINLYKRNIVTWVKNSEGKTLYYKDGFFTLENEQYIYINFI